MACSVAEGLLHALNEACYTIAILGEVEHPSEPPPGSRRHDPRSNFRMDRWMLGGSSMDEYIAGVSDCRVAMAAFEAAGKRWPKSSLTLR